MVEIKGTPFQTDNLTAAQAVKSSQKNYQFDLMPFVTLPNKIFSLFMRKNWNGSSRPPLNTTTL